MDTVPFENVPNNALTVFAVAGESKHALCHHLENLVFLYPSRFTVFSLVGSALRYQDIVVLVTGYSIVRTPSRKTTPRVFLGVFLAGFFAGHRALFEIKQGMWGFFPRFPKQRAHRRRSRVSS